MNAGHAAVIDNIFGEPRRAGQVGGGQQAVVPKHVEADQERVAGERREQLIGRVPVACRSKRQNLPDALAGGFEKIRKRNASGPSSPIPKWPGRDVGCSRMPLARGNISVSLQQGHRKIAQYFFHAQDPEWPRPSARSSTPPARLGKNQRGVLPIAGCDRRGQPAQSATANSAHSSPSPPRKRHNVLGMGAGFRGMYSPSANSVAWRGGSRATSRSPTASRRLSRFAAEFRRRARPRPSDSRPAQRIEQVACASGNRPDGGCPGPPG